MTSDQIRQQFIDFFVKKHGHTFVPSSPVVPHDDPSLLFTNAGMNQFKPIFLGQETRAYTRAANTQKCIRAGGKHNDLDDVGRSRRHHTFFEMLGNWSFGDYFKAGAIEMAWELLTGVWGLDPTRLHVSCYEGNPAAGIPRDDEAAELWKRIAKLPDDHIHYFGKDNFWEMGDTGPCGPCTEIYIDRTPDKTGGKDVNGDDPRVMEIWNLVFIQFNRDANGKLTPLPAQHVDTGMGFERICQVLQEKQDNYAIDLWSPLFDAISEISNLKYTGKFPPTNAVDPVVEAADAQLRHDIAFRVVADHVRCLTFALTDGASPSNEGRGYVLRRILRRAVRFGRQQLGLHEPFMHKLVPVVIESMSGAFPELKRNPRRVIELIEEEEVSFGKTLDRGIALFEDAVRSTIGDAYARIFLPQHVGFAPNRGISRRADGSFDAEDLLLITADGTEHSGFAPIGVKQAREALRDAGQPPVAISADDAFKLHDTYGFPIDLTRIMAEERGMTVDVAGYEKLMEEARCLARAGGKKDSDFKLDRLTPDALAQLAQSGVRPTDDSFKFSHEPVSAKIMAIWDGTDLGLSPADVLEDEELAIILDRTNFYAEMGGQVGDAGAVSAGPAASAAGVFKVETTKSVAGYVLHIGRLESGNIHVGQPITATVSNTRTATEKNHSTTHIANWALREVLGDDVQQKGSLVDADKLRFDFSHNKAMSDEELARVEKLVTERIERKLPVYAEVAPQELALKINGLRAVFGEKYPPMVRVVSIGVPVRDLLADPTNAKWREYSVEFCGGTHLANSGEAEAFVITAEESVSKGIRRIVALTGEAARTATATGKKIDELADRAAKTPDGELPGLIAAINSAVAGVVPPLRAKRRAHAIVGELQARLKAVEKSKAAESGGAAVDAVGIARQLLAGASPLGSGKLIVGEIKGASDDQLRSAVDSLKKQATSSAILVASRENGKVTFIAAVSDDLIVRGLKAGDWVREAAKIAGGGGGGRPQMAQAGGKDPSKLEAALDAARTYALSAVR
jgi:alanyl-tRNA synthetase